MMAPFDDATYTALQSKHPAYAVTPTDGQPPTPSNDSCLQLQETYIVTAIKSFTPGSARGPNGLRLQH